MELNPRPQHEEQRLSHLSHEGFVVHTTKGKYIPPSAPVSPNTAGVAQTLPCRFFLPTTTIDDATHPRRPSKTTKRPPRNEDADDTQRHSDTATHDVPHHRPPTTTTRMTLERHITSTHTRSTAGEDDGDEVVPSPGKQAERASQPPF